jgi:hypothetical protein
LVGFFESFQFCGLAYYYLQFDRILLSDQDHGCQVLSERAQLLKQEIAHALANELRKTIQTLSGTCSENVNSTNDCRTVFESSQYDGATKKQFPFLYKLSLYPIFLIRYLFGDLVGCLNEIKNVQGLSHKYEFSPTMTSIFTFIEGLTLISNARTKGHRICCRAKYCSYVLRRFTQLEPYGHLGRLMLLEAEMSDLFGFSEDYTFPKYVAAISTAINSGSLLTIAITNEVTAKYIVRKHRKEAVPPQHAVRYFDEAIAVYKQWGATAKVLHLEQEMKEYGYQRV